MKTIAVIGAMREEIAPLLDIIGNYESVNLGGNIYYKSFYKGCNIIIAYSKIGKVHAAITCSTMILKFNVDYIIFTGVAGGISNDLKIGDLVLASSLCQYDIDITAFNHPLGFIPESSVYINSTESLNIIARKVASFNQIILKEGIVASGDTFIFSNEKKKWIKDNFNAIAVEMEGASIAVAAHLFRIPFCVIRTISDVADEQANINFDDFLLDSAKNSATFTISMIELITSDTKVTL